MRAALAALALLAAIEPAEACRHFRIWHYNFPQRCTVTMELRSQQWAAPAPAPAQPRPAPIAFVPPAPPHTPTPQLSLPNLTEIDWGKTPDDDALGRMKLRAVLQAKESR